MMGTPYAAAAFRALIGAAISFGSVFFTTALSAGDKTALYAAGASAFAYLAIRLGGEGSYDSRMEKKADDAAARRAVE